ncbi:MAG: DivIVA domain-containing protein [Actinomycetia bacterium]|nr:DivIVA domain-containing protein [Actinomycetes bacterium]
MTLIVFLVIGILVVTGAALAYTGKWSVGMNGTDRPPAPTHPKSGQWTGEALRKTKFRVALRGYRMQDVDAVLASLATQLEEQPPGQGTKPDDSGQHEGTSGSFATPVTNTDSQSTRQTPAKADQDGSADASNSAGAPAGGSVGSSGLAGEPQESVQPPYQPPAR